MRKAMQYLKQILKQHNLTSNTNWLYHQPKLLSYFNVATGEQVLAELKSIVLHQLRCHYLAGSLATLRKLNDVSHHPDAFYNANDYEFISLKNLQLILTHKIKD